MSKKLLSIFIPSMAGGGAERVALTLAQDWLQRGHRVDLVVMEKGGELEGLVPDGVRLIALNVNQMRRAIRPFADYLQRERPFAVQVSLWPLTVIAVLARKLARSNSRLVLSEHVALTKQYAHFSLATQLLLKYSTRWAYPRADALLVVSDDAAKDVAMLAGMAKSDIETVYNPLTIPPAKGGNVAAIEALWGIPNGQRILHVGKLKAQKNQALLIRAFARLEGHDDARLMILGQGELEAELRALAGSLGVTDRVIFAGFQLDPAPYYASADLFVLSSDYEGFGLVLVEALANGLSVISTDCESGPREILADGDYGTLVPCGDAEALAAAMDEALRHPSDPERSRARAEIFGGAQSLERYHQLMMGQ